MRICYILSYSFPNYVRTKTILEALKRINNVKIYTAINTSRGIFRYFQTLYKLFVIRLTVNPDCYILGFRGYEIFLIVRLLTIGRTLIFDHMMSPYDSLLNERKVLKKDGLLDKLIYFYEKSVLKYSDIILTDTTLHKKFFLDLFKLPSKKIHAVHVGADEELFQSRSINVKSKEKNHFEVFFYGTFLPLHGVDIILEASYILRNIPIKIVIVGGGKKNLRSIQEKEERLKLKNVIHKEWVDYKKLPQMISKSDICLGGPFGNTGQAKRVITGKTFQFLAMGKPTVIGKIARDRGFRDKRNCILVPQGNAGELANAIFWCFKNQEKLGEIGQRGLKLYRNNFSIDHITYILKAILQL